jgi:segregation and condensation protein B
MDISSKIEALLFYKAEPVSLKNISNILKIDLQSVEQGLVELHSKLEKRGLSLVRTEDEVVLGTSKELSSLIEEITKEEISRDLGRAGLETLSIILYQGPISRADIDYIRGVNSQFILRNLLIRGLIERVDNKADARVFLYKSSLALLAHLGIPKIEDLPEYETVRKDIDSYKNNAIKDQLEK